MKHVSGIFCAFIFMVVLSAHSVTRRPSSNAPMKNASLAIDPTVLKCIELLSKPPNPPAKPLDLNLAAVIKQQILDTLAENAANNAWLDGGYHSNELLKNEMTK